MLQNLTARNSIDIIAGDFNYENKIKFWIFLQTTFPCPDGK